jgi:hypothetical protein
MPELGRGEASSPSRTIPAVLIPSQMPPVVVPASPVPTSGFMPAAAVLAPAAVPSATAVLPPAAAPSSAGVPPATAVLASAAVPPATAVLASAAVPSSAAVTTSPVLRRGRIGGRNRQHGYSSDEQLGRTHHRQLSREVASELKRKDANWHSVIVSHPRRSG